MPLRVDTARHVHRPGAHTPAAGQNFLYDPATGKIRSLDDRELFRRIAISYRICRIYAFDNCHNAELAAALDRLTGAGGTRRCDEYVIARARGGGRGTRWCGQFELPHQRKLATGHSPVPRPSSPCFCD